MHLDLDDLRRYGCEFLGTLFLVFFAAGAVTIDALNGGALGTIGSGLASGLIVTTVIYAIGYVSGAHVNPAVSVAACLIGHLDRRHLPGYIVAQLLGSIAAGFLVLGFLGDHNQVGANLPGPAAGGSPWLALAMEFLLSLLLMWLIAGVGLDRRAHGPLAGLAVGGLVAIEVMVFGPYSGASMNPARSLGPHLATGHIDLYWIYVLGPLAGMVAGAYAYYFTHNAPQMRDFSRRNDVK
jgi:MIP family channel proteins